MSSNADSVPLNTLTPGIPTSVPPPLAPPTTNTAANGGGSGNNGSPHDTLAGITANSSREQLEQVIAMCMRRMDALGHRLQRTTNGFFDEANWKWKLACTFLALWGVIMPTYLTYHFNGPANALSRQSLLASKWANYYTWLYTVCPAEQARNMSTPECERAQNHTTPPLKMPTSSARRSVEVQLAQLFWPDLNATAALQAEFDATNEFCMVHDGPSSDLLGTTYPLCQMLRSSYDDRVTIHTRRSAIHLRLVVPVPPTRWTAVESFYSTPLGVIAACALVYFYFWMFLSHLDLHLAARRAGYTLIHGLSLWCRPAEGEWIIWRVLWIFYLASMGTWDFSVLRSALKELAMWVAKDDLTTRCLSNENPTETFCTMFSEVMANLSTTEKINVIALWRGYISISIENRVDGFLFFFWVCVTAWLWLLVFVRSWECLVPHWQSLQSHLATSLQILVSPSTGRDSTDEAGSNDERIRLTLSEPRSLLD